MTTRKKLVILLWFALLPSLACPADFHLVQMQMVDADSNDQERLTVVYALFIPDKNPTMMFTKFGSEAMKDWLSSLPHGSIVYYDAKNSLPKVPSADVDLLKTYCQTNGVKFVESNAK